MHTGKEGTEAMPYFDTFDLETIDILLISQYVLSFPFSASAVVNKHLEEGGLGFFQRQGFEDENDNSREIVIIAGRVTQTVPLGIANQSDCTIRADRQYKSVHCSPSPYFLTA
jgi:hypothetical protein